ncbi:hypothetical protein QBC43DRAFT_330377 [Cladorrhinum sp. PSN259]|nr:hypothetical protein QBC43DRAFT_330377 [Cladorrhinum sp. PSN259]
MAKVKMDNASKGIALSVTMNTKNRAVKGSNKSTRGIALDFNMEKKDGKGKILKEVAMEPFFAATDSDKMQAKQWSKSDEAFAIMGSDAPDVEMEDKSSDSDSDSDPDAEKETTKAEKPDDSKPEAGEESSSEEDSTPDDDKEMEDAADDATSKTVTKGPANKEAFPEGLNRKARRRLLLISRQKIKIMKRLGISEDSTEPNEKVDKELEEWTAKFDKLADVAAARRTLKVRNREANKLPGDEKEAALDAIVEEKRALAKASAGLKTKEKKRREKKLAKEVPAKGKQDKKSKATEKTEKTEKSEKADKSTAEKSKRTDETKADEKPRNEAKPKAEATAKADDSTKKSKKKKNKKNKGNKAE